MSVVLIPFVFLGIASKLANRKYFVRNKNILNTKLETFMDNTNMQSTHDKALNADRNHHLNESIKERRESKKSTTKVG